MISKYEGENVRSIFNTPISELQKTFLNTDPHESFPYIYTGLVVSNSDPLKQGRLKIKVINLFDELSTADIPWAYPCQNLCDGSFSIPNEGDYLEVYFDHGDVYNPKYLSKAINLDQIPTQASTDYPNTIVIFETKEGSYCTLNKTTGEYKIVQSTGSKMTIDKDGAYELDVSSTKLTIDKNGKVEINSPDVTITGGKLSVKGSVAPATTGGFNCLKQCLFTGVTHTGDTVVGT